MSHGKILIKQNWLNLKVFDQTNLIRLGAHLNCHTKRKICGCSRSHLLVWHRLYRFFFEYPFFFYTVGDGLQAIQLEDGTTAYISQSAASLFSEGAAGIDANALNLEQLQAQVGECVNFQGIEFLSDTSNIFNCQIPVVFYGTKIRTFLAKNGKEKKTQHGCQGCFELAFIGGFMLPKNLHV